MQAIVWILRLIVVVILVWFAARNSDPVKLRGFLPDQTWDAPLVFVLLVVFVAGMVIGLLAWVPTVVRQRRELGRLRKEAAARQTTATPLPVAPATEPPHGI